MKSSLSILLKMAFWGLLFIAAAACSPTGETGTIRGDVMLPEKINLSAAPPEAKVYIYLMDYTPNNGKEVPPWEAPTLNVVEARINSLENHRVSFEFREVPRGIYGISVLVDTGRPHVPENSLNFTAYPGDYAGGTKENLVIDDNQIHQVSINSGLYVTIPDGYQAPLYSPE